MQNADSPAFAAEVRQHLNQLWSETVGTFPGTEASVFAMADKAMAIPAANAEETARAVKAGLFAIRHIGLEVDPAGSTSRVCCFSPSRAVVRVESRCATRSVYSCATTLHEYAHAYQRALWGRITFNQLFSYKEGMLVGEADAWRIAFRWANSFGLLTTKEDYKAAFAYANACLATYDRGINWF